MYSVLCQWWWIEERCCFATHRTYWHTLNTLTACRPSSCCMRMCALTQTALWSTSSVCCWKIKWMWSVICAAGKMRGWFLFTAQPADDYHHASHYHQTHTHTYAQNSGVKSLLLLSETGKQWSISLSFVVQNTKKRSSLLMAHPS